MNDSALYISCRCKPVNGSQILSLVNPIDVILVCLCNSMQFEANSFENSENKKRNE